MAKTILMEMTLLVTLIVSAFAIGNTASGLTIPETFDRESFISGDQILIKSKGSSICLTASGGICGDGSLKSKVFLEMQNIGDTDILGDGKIKTMLKIHQMGGLELRGNTLSFTAGVFDETIEIQESLKARNGNTWQLNMIVTDIIVEENTGNCEITLSAPNGDIVSSETQCGVILMPVSS